ncbi:hypothetical protein O9929_12320 [Vibrio lentus]|nr:hypothetical protein [Vibrio lentus]
MKLRVTFSLVVNAQVTAAVTFNDKGAAGLMDQLYRIKARFGSQRYLKSSAFDDVFSSYLYPG